MKFTFTEKNIEVPVEAKEYAEKKIGKLEKYFRGDTAAFITFGFKRGRYTVEVTVNGGGTFFRVSETSTSAHAAIDSAEAAIERQIHKNKTRLEKRLRSGSLETTPLDPEITLALEQDPEEEEFNIVRRKSFSVKPMTTEEAILQMNLLDHSFFVYKNAEDEATFCIVYKRKDGGYGLIEALE